MRRAMVVLAWCAGAALAGAQGAPAPSSEAALTARLTLAVRSAVMPVIDSAAAQQLPTRPLLDKALEGQSKGASPDRIATVVRALVGELDEAGQALGHGSSESDLAAGASALHAGASPETLTELRRARGQGPLAVPLAVLTELVARGVAPDTASAAIVALTRQRVDDRELVSFRQGVEHDIALGATPSVSATMRAADGAGRSSGSPSTSSVGGVTGSSSPPPPPQRP